MLFTHSGNAKHDQDAFRNLSVAATARSPGVDPHWNSSTLLSAAECTQTFERYRHEFSACEAQSLLQSVPGCTIPMHSIYDKQMCRSGSQHIYLTLITSTSGRQLVSRVLVDENLCCGQQRLTQMSSWYCDQSVSIIDAVCAYPMVQCACIAQISDELKMH